METEDLIAMDGSDDLKKSVIDNDVTSDVMRSPVKSPKGATTPARKTKTTNQTTPKSKGTKANATKDVKDPVRIGRPPKKRSLSSPRRRSTSSGCSPKTTSASAPKISDAVTHSPKGTKRPKSHDGARRTPTKAAKSTDPSESPRKKAKLCDAEESMKVTPKRGRPPKPTDTDSYARTIERVIAMHIDAADPFKFDDKVEEKPTKPKKPVKESPVKHEVSIKTEEAALDDSIVKKRGRPKGSKNKVKSDSSRKRPRSPKSKSIKSETDSSPEKPPLKKAKLDPDHKVSVKDEPKPKKMGRKASPTKAKLAKKPSRSNASNSTKSNTHANTRRSKPTCRTGKVKAKTGKPKTWKAKKAGARSKARVTNKSSGDESSCSAKSKKSMSPKYCHKSSDDEQPDGHYVKLKKKMISKYKASNKLAEEKNKLTKSQKKPHKREYVSSQSSEDDERFDVVKYPKKAFRDKWKREQHKSPEPEAAALPGRSRREHKKRSVTFGLQNSFNFFTDDESDSAESYSEPETKPKPHKTSLRKTVKKVPDVAPPRRTARIASLNALAMMHCMNEDAKVSLSHPHKDSLAIVPHHESTIACQHSDNSEEESDSDSDSGPRKRKVEVKKPPPKRRRRRRNELGVKMDMCDMVVTKRMASLNASAIMAASYCMESRSRRMPASTSSENEVTDVDIKRKISYQATKDAKSRSVITVQETTKKVKKAQGSRETEVEEHIIVKKKVKRQNEVESNVESDKDDGNVTDASEIDHQMLPKTPDSGMMIESTITFVTTKTLTGPKTASGNSLSSTDGKTTTVVQHVQRKAITTTSSATSSSASSVSVSQPSEMRQNSPNPPGVPQKYSPLGALSDMHPVSHPHLPPHPAPYPHHQHIMPPPHPGPYTHASIPPHQPYPPLSPHSPPYPPPSRSSPASSSAATCPSPSATPRSYASSHRISPYPSAVPSPWDERLGMGPPSSRPHGCERHHSAFTAPTPSAHSPVVGHGYQPVSGPMPLGSPTSSTSYKAQTQVTAAPVSYAPPPSLMSAPQHKPYKPPEPYGVPHNSPYPAHAPHPPPHHYPQHYDKYLRQSPYPLYPSQYPPIGPYGHGDYNYHHPQGPGMHYAQEYSYTLCVPPAGPTHSSHQALALPPPPSASQSAAPPYYHCAEYPPVFTYPPSGTILRINVLGPPMPPQSAICCPPNSKNVQPGPLIGAGKGPVSDAKEKWVNQQYYHAQQHPASHPGPVVPNQSNAPVNANQEPHVPTNNIINTAQVPAITAKVAPAVSKSETKTQSEPTTKSPKEFMAKAAKDTIPPVSLPKENGAPPPTDTTGDNPQQDTARLVINENRPPTTTWVAQPSASVPPTASVQTPPSTNSSSVTSTTQSNVPSAVQPTVDIPIDNSAIDSKISPHKAAKLSKLKPTDHGLPKKRETKHPTHRGPRHLLCQPQPLSHVKTSSVLPKTKPAHTPKGSLDAKDIFAHSPLISSSKNSLGRSPGVASSTIQNSDGFKEATKGDRCPPLPRKRGRPPKSKTLDNVETEEQQFFRDTGPKPERPRRRMSLLASVDPPDCNGHELVVDLSKTNATEEPDTLSVKTELTGSVKLETPTLPTKEDQLAAMKPLNGDSVFDEMPNQQKLFLEPLKSDVPLLPTLKIEQPTKPLVPMDDVSPPAKSIRVGRPAKKQSENGKIRRNASSLLSYLNYNFNDDNIDIRRNDDDEQQATQDDTKKHKMVPFPPCPTQFARKRRMSGSAKNKMCKKPKYFHGWAWDGQPHEGKVWLRNDEVLMPRKCYMSMKHKQGDCISVRDCVLLRSGPRKTDLPFVAKVAALWEDPETCDMMMSILWYYRPEHTEFGRRPEDLTDEIFASKHRDHLSVACIEDRCFVLTFNEYCRYRRRLRLFQERAEPTSSPVPDGDHGYSRRARQPQDCVVQDLLFFCRKIYDYRQKRILKNPWESTASS